MNPIIVLIALLAISILAAPFIAFRIRREEVINAKAADAEAETEAPSVDPVAAEAAAEIAAMKPAAAPKGVTEEEIAAKVKAGLTRDQAIEVIERQLAEDKAAKAKK